MALCFLSCNTLSSLVHLALIKICTILLVVATAPAIHQTASCTVLLYADLSISETTYIFHILLRQTGKCRCKIEWRDRLEFLHWQEGTEKDTAVILAASFGPSDAEQAVLRSIPEYRRCLVLHFSDELLLATDSAIYGKATKSFRNYFHPEMGNSSLDYLLLDKLLSPVPRVLWMPLGIANLKALPLSFTYKFMERPLLWSWAGSTENKPERTEMLKALEIYAGAEHIMRRGSLHTFKVFAGQEGLSRDSMNSWQYSMIMQRTQFIPTPAGISAEQFRVWESIEAGVTLVTTIQSFARQLRITHVFILYPHRSN